MGNGWEGSAWGWNFLNRDNIQSRWEKNLRYASLLVQGGFPSFSLQIHNAAPAPIRLMGVKGVPKRNPVAEAAAAAERKEEEKKKIEQRKAAHRRAVERIIDFQKFSNTGPNVVPGV